MDKIEENNKIMEIVENVLYFNDEDQDQQEQGLKILTLNQILSRLPISLVQLNAGNNSKNLKKIRQIWYKYSLHRSKKFTKNVYKGLIYII